MTDIFPVEGWAAVYDDADLNGDIIAPGAFRRSIASTGVAGVKFLYQHAVEQPIGRWLSFEERARGLYAKGEIFLATRVAREVAALVKGDIIDGLSIGYRTRKSAKAPSGRRILDADLWEVSIVTFPMAPKARLVLPDRAPGLTSREDQVRAFAQSVREAARILSQ
jgi:hypothetical protein